MSALALGHQSGVTGKTVLVRIHLSDAGISDLVAPVRALAGEGARVALVAGHGEPQGEFNPALTLRGSVERLESAIGLPVSFVADSVGIAAEAGLARVPVGAVALLENVRFHSEARRAAPVFAVRLSALADFFVVTGPLPARPANWITQLKTLLPEPPSAPALTRKEA